MLWTVFVDRFPECVARRCVQVFHAKIDAQTQVANAGIMAEKAKRDHAKIWD